ncbi:MAG: helicase-related protein, partial [Candidatus Sericytochromatia bacterium]
VQVEVVTGTLPPDERQDRVAAMEQSEQRVLVCTDCLSEGINLQQYFDTVIHYDLSWNPTRHEQREGRVDRYGQPQDQIRVITYYCLNNEIDPIVMKVLLRKHQAIRRALGISVPVPVSSAMVLDTIFEELIIKQNQQMEMIPGLKEQLDEMEDWVNATENEKASRSLFAQFTIKTDEVEQELQAMQRVLGSGQAVKSFVLDALEALGGTVGEARNQTYALQFKETPMPLQDRLSLNKDKGLLARFELPLRDHETYLHRTSPLVEQLAGYVLDTALDSQQKSPAARAAVIRTPDVNVTTTLLLVRFRFHLLTRRQNKDDTLLAEECRLIAFEGMAQNPTWLSQEAAEKLLEAKPSANIPVQQAQMMLKQITQNFEPIQKALDTQAHAIGQTLLESHRRVRQEAKTVTAYDVQARTPVDVLGVYLYMKG